MPIQLCTGALLTCPFGAAPASFLATPRPVLTCGRPAGVITDHQPLLHILPFGLCSAPANPAVIAATAAALGVPTPAPCVPATATPWLPGAISVLIGGVPALNDTSTLACAWGGVITVAFPGQITHLMP